MYTRIMEISPWTLRSAKLEKEHKRLQESLTSLGNGYMGMRGSLRKPIPPTATWVPTSPACGSPTNPRWLVEKRLS